MCFSGCEDPDDVMEVKVYRAKGRQRVRPELQDYRDVMPSKGAEAPKSRLKGVNGIRQVIHLSEQNDRTNEWQSC